MTKQIAIVREEDGSKICIFVSGAYFALAKVKVLNPLDKKEIKDIENALLVMALDSIEEYIEANKYNLITN